MTTPATPLPAADAGVEPPPTPRRRRLWFLLAALVAVAAAVPLVVLAIRDDPPANPDHYQSAPKCDLFSAETLAELDFSPVPQNQPEESGYGCGWPLAAGGFVVVNTRLFPPDGTGTAKAAKAAQAVARGETLRDPKVGDAAWFLHKERNCEVNFHRSNVTVRVALIADEGVDCRQRVLDLAVEFDRNLSKWT